MSKWTRFPRWVYALLRCSAGGIFSLVNPPAKTSTATILSERGVLAGPGARAGSSGGRLPALCLLTLLALTMLASCSKSKPYAPPPASVKKLPAYPGAQQPQVTPTVLYPDIPSETITFSTRDKPETVLAFYRDTLVKEGWELSNYHPLDTDIRFVWSRGCPLYVVDVLTKAGEGGHTEVEVKTAVDLCL